MNSVSIDQLEYRFQTRRTVVDLKGRTVELTHPSDSGDLIDEDFLLDERLPFWVDVWPSAVILSRALIKEKGRGKRLLELGCGTGLCAVAATVAGYDVLASDYYDDALLVTKYNVEQNVAGASVRTRLVDWRAWPKRLGRFDRVVAADVLYEPEHAELIARAVSKSLGESGVATVADPAGRISRSSFVDRARQHGLIVDVPKAVPCRLGKTRNEITLIELRWP
jgi:predicted nicotinamide N-methyase